MKANNFSQQAGNKETSYLRGIKLVLVLSYAKNIGIKRAISSGNPEHFKKLVMLAFGL